MLHTLSAPPPAPGTAGLLERLLGCGVVGPQPGAGVRVGGSGRGARGSVRVRIAAPGSPKEGPLCSLAQDGGFCGRMCPRTLQKTCKGRAVEASGGGGTVILPRVRTQRVPGDGDVG